MNIGGPRENHPLAEVLTGLLLLALAYFAWQEPSDFPLIVNVAVLGILSFIGVVMISHGLHRLKLGE